MGGEASGWVIAVFFVSSFIHNVYIYDNLHKCIHIYVCACVFVYVCMYVSMYLCMYACMYVCMFICLFVKCMRGSLFCVYVCLHVHVCSLQGQNISLDGICKPFPSTTAFHRNHHSLNFMAGLNLAVSFLD